jgi:hypothetical protein
MHMERSRARILGCLKFDIGTRIANGRPDLQNLATIHDYSGGQVKITNSAALVECLKQRSISDTKGHVLVTVHREGRKAEVPLGGSHQILDPRVVRQACEELGLDWSQLPGSKSRV